MVGEARPSARPILAGGLWDLAIHAARRGRDPRRPSDQILGAPLSSQRGLGARHPRNPPPDARRKYGSRLWAFPGVHPLAGGDHGGSPPRRVLLPRTTEARKTPLSRGLRLRLVGRRGQPHRPPAPGPGDGFYRSESLAGV